MLRVAPQGDLDVSACCGSGSFTDLEHGPVRGAVGSEAQLRLWCANLQVRCSRCVWRVQALQSEG